MQIHIAFNSFSFLFCFFFFFFISSSARELHTRERTKKKKEKKKPLKLCRCAVVGLFLFHSLSLSQRVFIHTHQALDAIFWFLFISCRRLHCISPTYGICQQRPILSNNKNTTTTHQMRISFHFFSNIENFISYFSFGFRGIRHQISGEEYIFNVFNDDFAFILDITQHP